MFKKHRVPQNKWMDLTENLLWHVKKNVQEEMHKIWFIYQHVILWIYDSSLCLVMGECFIHFAAIQPVSCCLSLSSPYPQDLPISQLWSPPIENSELYIYADVSDLPFS